jgi:hypothetical protein
VHPSTGFGSITPYRHRLPTDTGSKELSYRSLGTEIKQLPAFADFVLQQHFGEPQSKDHCLPGINTEYLSFLATNKSLQPNWTTPVITFRLWSTDRYMNR